MPRRSSLKRDDRTEASPVVAAPARGAGAGRIGVYTALGASIGAIPLPWLPDSLLRRVRGALAHDVAVRHGVSLSREARDVLADPTGLESVRGPVAQAVRFVGVRLAARSVARFAPVGLVWPLLEASRTWALGHLLGRYLERARKERAVRIDADEARRVRRAIDGALTRAVAVDPGRAEEPTPVDDQRDPGTALVDALLGLVAGVPERLVRRLDAAFDDLSAHLDA